MSSDNIFTTKIVPLTSGPEVEVNTESAVRQHDIPLGQDEHNLRAHYLLANTSQGSGTVLRNVAGAPTVVEVSYSNGMQGQQTQLMQRVTNLESELARAKQEIAQLKDLNTILQQGIPDVIRKTLSEELRKPRWSGLNPTDPTFPQNQGSSRRRRSKRDSSTPKRHKAGPTQRAVLKARDTPAKMTKKLLTTFFDRDTLAMSTLTGRGGKSKTLTKAQLDPSVVKTIVDKVTTTYGISECSVRIIISQKCKEEMMIRRRRLNLESKATVMKSSTG